MSMEMEMLRIGEVAAQAEVNIQTLRYYERRGLLKEPSRRPSGYREYDPDAIRVVRFIKRAQELGFTLVEIQDLLRLRESKRSKCAEVKAAAVSKMADIDRKLRSLRAMKRALEVLVGTCTNGASLECPILEALDRSERKEAAQ